VTLLCVGIASAFRWSGTTPSGAEVTRTLRILVNTDSRFTILATQSFAHSKRVADAIEWTFSTQGFPHFVFRHFQAATDTTEKRAARHGYRKLIEYEENPNGTAGFEPGIDQIVQNYYFWQGRTWSPLSVVKNADSNGVTTYSVCTSTSDGVVTLCAYLTNIHTNITVNGTLVQLDNHMIHHTMSVVGFPYSSSTSRLALKTHFEAHTRVAQWADSSSLGSDEDAIDLSDDGDDHKPVAVWDDFVTVTGTDCSDTAPVLRSTIMLNESIYDVDALPTGAPDVTISISLIERITYFSYLTDCPMPSKIFWDPDFGMQYEDGSDVTSVANAATYSALVAIALLAMLF